MPICRKNGSLVAVEPHAGHLGHEIVGVQVLGRAPDVAAEALGVIGHLALGDAGRLLDPSRPERLVPGVEVKGQVRVGAVLVLGDVALVVAEGALDRPGVHLADVHRAVARLLQQPDPRIDPALVVAEDAVGVRICPREQRGSRRAARGRGHVHLLEGGALVHQPVEVGRVHPRAAQGPDGVDALLVGDDEDDIGVFCHGLIPSRHRPETGRYTCSQAR